MLWFFTAFKRFQRGKRSCPQGRIGWMNNSPTLPDVSTPVFPPKPTFYDLTWSNFGLAWANFGLV
jgi:hypothetical protein